MNKNAQKGTKWLRGVLFEAKEKTLVNLCDMALVGNFAGIRVLRDAYHSNRVGKSICDLNSKIDNICDLADDLLTQYGQELTEGRKYEQNG